MSDSPLRIVPNKPVEPEPTEAPPSPAEELRELRRLLVEPEQTQINNILERLNNPRVRARELSRALPEAIRQRSQEDESLTEVLTPTIVTAFHGSIKKDPTPVVEAISPIMGPAIRRSIANALRDFLQSLDQTLKYSFSWQGMKWRFEALRTGKSFAEVVLYHTMIYRAEQAFLIHQQSGLLLQHVAVESVATHDADMISGMLTAIQEAVRSFGRDSFGSIGDETLPSLPLGGDREIWIETGPKAVLAVVMRGHPPESLRTEHFIPALEAIHIEMREALENFDGDDTPFTVIRRHLEDCLQSQFEANRDAKQFRVPAYFRILLALIVLALLVWAGFAWRDQRRWTGYLNRLKQEPGIVITETGRQDGKRWVAGLRDPLAASPDTILRQETKIEPTQVAMRWDPYQALDSRFLLQRATTLLAPPEGVTLTVDNGTLIARGSAPTAWIRDARRFALVIPGISAFDEKNLSNSELKEPEEIRQSIQQRIIRFQTGTASIVPGQNQAMRQLLDDLKRLERLLQPTGLAPMLQLIGHTDTEGDEQSNLRLSRERAETISRWLTARGIRPETISARGVGASEPVRPESSAADREFNRSVSVQLTFGPPKI